MSVIKRLMATFVLTVYSVVVISGCSHSAVIKVPRENVILASPQGQVYLD